jgi:hypothetical protein
MSTSASTSATRGADCGGDEADAQYRQKEQCWLLL